MKKYKVIFEVSTENAEKKLNKLSKKGYEFVSSNISALGLLVIMCKEVNKDD